MMTEDLKTYSEMGRALWADLERSRKISIDTLGAVALKDLNDEQILEAGTSALLSRVQAEGAAANAHFNMNVIDRAFFRLSPEERIVLVGLHSGRWSYGRLARIFETGPEKIQELAWRARTRLAADIPRSQKIPYPVGNKPVASQCPEYDFDKPWTQRFLDEEFKSGGEKLYLQRHLLACQSCREALNACRVLYYAVDAAIPRLDAQFLWNDELKKVLRKSELVRSPASITPREALAAYARTGEFQLMALGVFIWFLNLSLHRFLR